MKKGSKMTLEQRKKVSEGHKGIIAGMKGKKHSEETKRKISETKKEAYSNLESRKILSDIMKKTWNNPKMKKKQSESIKKLWLNPEYKKRMSESHKGFEVKWETKEKLRKINTGKKMSLESIKKMVEKRIKEGSYKHSKDSRRKIGLAAKGRPAWNKGVNFPTDYSQRSDWQIKVSKSSRERLLKLYESGSFPKQENTKPERQIKKELIKRKYKEGKDFIHQYRFMNKFMCDFCFPQQKVIVEVYGDFWHANPKKYPEGSPLHPHQIKGKRIDKSKEAYITKVDNHAWTYLVLWESDIKKDVVKCVDKIKEVLAKKKRIGDSIKIPIKL